MTRFDYGREFQYYVYLNEGKVNSLFSQINGGLISEWKTQEQRGTKVLGKLLVSIGSIFAKIGIGKIEADGGIEKSYHEMVETLGTLSVENKLRTVLHYYDESGDISVICLHENSEAPDIMHLCKTILIDSSFKLRNLHGNNFSKKKERKAFSDAVFSYMFDEEKKADHPIGGTFYKATPNIPIIVPFVLANFRPDQGMAYLLKLFEDGVSEHPGFDMCVWGTWQKINQSLRIDPIAMWYSDTLPYLEG